MTALAKTNAPPWVTEVNELIAEGESSFWKVAIIIERQKEEGMKQHEIAEALGKSQFWVSKLLKWKKTNKGFIGDTYKTPFAGQKPKKRKTKDWREGAKTFLLTLPKEERMNEITDLIRAVDLNIRDWISAVHLWKKGA